MLRKLYHRSNFSKRLVLLSVVAFLILNGCVYLYLGRLDETVVHVAYSSCGDRTEETFVSIKSAVLLSTSRIMFHIFTDTASRPKFVLMFDQIRQPGAGRLSYQLYDSWYPSSGNLSVAKWKTLFRACAAQRLFMHVGMPKVDAILYVDTDTLFTASLTRTWDLFRNFNSTHLVSMVEEQFSKSAKSFYDRPRVMPHYGTKGLNSGVMLMNLTRLRAKPWESELAKYYTQYKKSILLGDQDLLNIYFHYHPDEVYPCPCGTNYRPDLCDVKVTCKQPPIVLHGNRFVWHNRKEPAFKAVYDAFRSHNITSRLVELSIAICKNLKNASKSNCGTALNTFVEEISGNIEPNIRLNQTSCTIIDL